MIARSLRLSGPASDDEGATLVEFALVVPVLILALVVCLDLARGLNAYVTVANASREAARYASVHPEASPTDPGFRDFLASRVVPLDPAALVVTVAPVPTAAPAGGPAWSAAAPAPGAVVVRIRYPWSAATGMTGGFLSAASGSPLWFDVSSTMGTLR